MSTIPTNDITTIQTIRSLGYVATAKIADTLQGSIWKSSDPSTGEPVVLKLADKHQSQSQTGIVHHQEYKVQENIEKESQILKQLSTNVDCPKSIVKYLSSGQSDQHHVLIMEHGGECLFNFVNRVHQCIGAGCLDIAEWHAMVKIIFGQMIDCVAYIHSKNVCHFDISLENFLINDVNIQLMESATDKPKMIFCLNDKDSVRIKCCDFGLAERFANANHGFPSNKYCGKAGYQSPEISSHKERFSAQSNDVWCLGACLFMMITGCPPFRRSVATDDTFNLIMNGELMTLLSHWDKTQYVNEDIVSLLCHFFRFEETRITIDKLKQTRWLSTLK